MTSCTRQLLTKAKRWPKKGWEVKGNLESCSWYWSDKSLRRLGQLGLSRADCSRPGVRLSSRPQRAPHSHHPLNHQPPNSTARLTQPAASVTSPRPPLPKQMGPFSRLLFGQVLQALPGNMERIGPGPDPNAFPGLAPVSTADWAPRTSVHTPREDQVLYPPLLALRSPLLSLL